MNLLGFALLRKRNVKSTAKKFKRNAILVGVITRELFEFIYLLVTGTYKLIKSIINKIRSFYRKESVVKKASNVIDFNEYKQKKAQ